MTPLSVFLSRFLPSRWVAPAMGVTYALLLAGVVLLFGYEGAGPEILYIDLGR